MCKTNAWSQLGWEPHACPLPSLSTAAALETEPELSSRGMLFLDISRGPGSQKGLFIYRHVGKLGWGWGGERPWFKKERKSRDLNSELAVFSFTSSI